MSESRGTGTCQPNLRTGSKNSSPYPVKDGGSSNGSEHFNQSSSNPSRTPSAAHSISEDGQSSVKWKSLFNFTSRKHTLVIIISVLTSILIGTFTPVQSYLLGRVFGIFADFASGSVSELQFKHNMRVYNLYFVALATTNWVFTALFFASWVLFGELQARSARERLFKALVHRNIEWFDQKKDGVGAMTIKLQSFISDLQDATGQPLGMALRDLTTAVVSFGLALYQSWKLTLVVLSTLPTTFIIVPLVSKKLQQAIDKQTEVLSEATKCVKNSLVAIDTVKCYNGQRAELWRYAALLKLGEKYHSQLVNWSALQTAVLRLVALAMFVQGFWYGSTLVQDTGDTNTAGNILTAFWSCIAATSALMRIMPLMISLEKGKVAGHRLRMLMVATSLDQTQLLPERRIPTSCAANISFENVHFAYPSHPNRPILQGINLSFGTENLTFIIGKSGSGKSTIGQLLVHFYKPSAGKITLDGLSIDMIDTEWLRSNILLVEQTSGLFNTTLQENIAFGSKMPAKISIDDIRRATEFSMIHDTVQKMPQGFETRVGRKGERLSGGQRQRVALARAKIRDPEVLILDESTSELDHINRIAVMAAIRKWRKGRTTIIITHDIAQIQPNDFVYVMKNGLVVQSGIRETIEKVEVSHFQHFTRTPTKMSSKKHSMLNEMVLPASPEDAVLDSDDSEDESEQPKIEIQAIAPSTDVDQARCYSETPTSGWKSIWLSTMDSPYAAARSRQSWATSTLAAHSWSMMPSYRSTTVYGNHHPSMSTVKSQTSISLNVRQRADSPVLDKTLREVVTTHATTRPKSIMFRPTTPNDTYSVSTKVETDMSLHFDIKQTLATVWPNLCGWDRFRLVTGFVATLVFAASTPLFAFVFSKLLNTLYDPADREAQALKFSLVILGIAFIDAITIFISTTNNQSVAQSWINKLRIKALFAILEQPKEFFDRDESLPSKMAECLDHNAEMAQHILGRFVGSVLKVALMIGIAVTWSLFTCWRLTLVLLATIPALLLVARGLSSVGAVLKRQKQDAIERASAIFSETFSAITTVRILTLESYFEKKHLSASDDVAKEGFKEGIYVGVLYGLSQSLLLYIMALIFYFGSVLLQQKTYGLESIVQVLTLLLLSVSTATSILASIPQLSSAQEAVSRLLGLVNLPRKSYEHEGQLQITSIGDISFNNLQFTYPSRSGDLVLKNVSVHIPSGACVAFVGISGSGKSTMASILLKLYQTTASKGDILSHDVTFSGRSICQISTSALRNLVSIVSQTPRLFPTSVSGNIVYGLRASDPRNCAANVRAAATSAGIHDFVTSLPEGYDTLIGDGGLGISGGQAQRIAIARALARQPEVLILDEATSALDVENAGVIRGTVQRLMYESRMPGAKPLTVIIITHSIDMMQMAEKIIMLDEGKVTEEGPYCELLARNGRFARLLRGAG